jgi:hypothetical protein
MAPQETATKDRQGTMGWSNVILARTARSQFRLSGPGKSLLGSIRRRQQAGGTGSQPGTGDAGLRPWSQTVRIYGCCSGTFDRKFAVSKHIIPQGQSLKQDRTSHGRLGKDGRPKNRSRRVANAKDQGAEATRRRPCNDRDSRSHRSTCLTTTPTPHPHAHNCRQ